MVKMVEKHCFKSLVSLLLTVLIFCVVVPTAVAGKTITGGTIVIGEDETVEGFVAMGGTIQVKGLVDGDVTVVGGEVRISGRVDGDLEAYGGNIVIDGEITGDLETFGGNIAVGDEGEIGGSLKSGGGNVELNGVIGGDAEVNAGSISLGPNALINGDFEYSSESFNRDPNAQIRGIIKKDAARLPDLTSLRGPLGVVGLLGGLALIILSLYWLLLNLVIGGVLLTVSPKFAIEISDSVTEDPIKMGALGFLVLFGVPVLLLALLITIIGIPLALGGGLLFIFLVLIANIYGKFAIGMWLLSKTDRSNIWAALVVGLLTGFVLSFIPFIGGLLKLFILLLGLGALTYAIKARIRG
jgi:cytoskeletal protein CcmA (bactofilin family)